MCSRSKEPSFKWGRKRNASMTNFKVVVVDDESTIANTLCKLLRVAGYSAFAAYEAEGAMMLCKHHSAAMLIADVNMPRISGIELAQQVSLDLPGCHILLFSGHVDTAPRCAG